MLLDVNLLDTELVVLNLELENKYDVMTVLANCLLEKNIVKPSYLQALIEREDVYPTGLQTKEFGVAIPHADIQHVLKPSIAIATLKNSVKFNLMASPENTVDVKIVFMLALTEPQKQLQLLQDLISLFQASHLIKQMLKCDDRQMFIDIVNQINQNE
ncbi:PTS system, galactitol-specific IIA component [Propionispira arboris]|uniref:PTS system, galactitol-specific IIA component n=1 Tax=Propionispira arboris TaxID=84035 RepID=A0A1H7AQ57_9FIRM|nr:PTS sugar transporter subunit IIA [Propionispira arboris]SEJ67699.1 PTS system, galactitol-specific IIA component [Propionispira arboris]